MPRQLTTAADRAAGLLVLVIVAGAAAIALTDCASSSAGSSHLVWFLSGVVSSLALAWLVRRRAGR